MAKEQIEVGSTAEKPKMEEKRNMDEQRMLNNSRNQSVAGLNPEPSLVHDHKEVLDQTMCVITMDFKGILLPNCQKLRAMNSVTASRSRGLRNDRRNWDGEPSRDRNGDLGMMDVIKMISAFTNCLESFP